MPEQLVVVLLFISCPLSLLWVKLSSKQIIQTYSTIFLFSVIYGLFVAFTSKIVLIGITSLIILGIILLIYQFYYRKHGFAFDQPLFEKVKSKGILKTIKDLQTMPKGIVSQLDLWQRLSGKLNLDLALITPMVSQKNGDVKVVIDSLNNLLLNIYMGEAVVVYDEEHSHLYAYDFQNAELWIDEIAKDLNLLVNCKVRFRYFYKGKVLVRRKVTSFTGGKWVLIEKVDTAFNPILRFTKKVRVRDTIVDFRQQ